jgi:amino acid adenylation domain-containing protein
MALDSLGVSTTLNAVLPDATAERAVHEVVAARAASHPEALAVRAPDATLTYAQLVQRSNEVAARLRSLGVAAGNPVGLCLPRSAALIVGALGILEAGAAYVALDPSYPDDRLEFMLTDSAAPVVLADEAVAARLGPRHAKVLVVDATAPVVDPGPSSGSSVAGDDLAYIVYTSGSTGQPKGVLVDHSNLLNLVRWHRRAFSITADDRGTQIASPGFDATVWEVWPYLTAGASLHVAPEGLRIDPAGLRDWLVAEGITVTFVPTALAEELLALPWPRQPALRFLLTGGDALRRHPGPDIPFAVVNNYGPAEATVVATSGTVPPSIGAEAAPSIGRPIEGVSVHIVDAALEELPSGSAGELLIGGAGVARGYLNRPELTAERFLRDAGGGHTGARLYRTGDLVRARANGEIEFLGRVDDQVKISGRRIEPGEISATLNSHPAVRTSAVVATGDLPEQRRLVAFVVPADGAARDVDQLRSHLASRLPHYMVPADFLWLDELPMMPSDKVDRAALRAHVAGPTPRTAIGGAPRTELEMTLASVVAELLGMSAVGVDEDFFLLGGHSLLGAQVITRINDRFGVELPLRDLFESPTVAGMATAVERLLVAQLDEMSDEEAERLAAEFEAGLLTGTGH